MKSALLCLAVAGLCFGVAFRYFQPDLSWASGRPDKMTNVNQPLPHVMLPTLKNVPQDVAGYKGQVELVAFWATWCGYCVQEIPTFIHLQREYEDLGFSVVAIAVDDNGPEKVEPFVYGRHFQVDGESRPINYPVVRGNMTSAQTFGFHGLPVELLVDREGREVKIIRGTPDEAALEKEIQKLLN
jgi:thiol-disulfide isomerase/thioredoxin